MGEAGVIPSELAARLAPSAGERNILVHEYERIDDRIVYESINDALADYRAYGQAVLAYLNRCEERAKQPPEPPGRADEGQPFYRPPTEPPQAAGPRSHEA